MCKYSASIVKYENLFFFFTLFSFSSPLTEAELQEKRRQILQRRAERLNAEESDCKRQEEEKSADNSKENGSCEINSFFFCFFFGGGSQDIYCFH